MISTRSDVVLAVLLQSGLTRLYEIRGQSPLGPYVAARALFDISNGDWVTGDSMLVRELFSTFGGLCVDTSN